MNSMVGFLNALLTERVFLVDTIASIVVLILTLLGLPLFLYRGCTLRPRNASKSVVKLIKRSDNMNNSSKLSIVPISNTVIEVHATQNNYESMTFELLDKTATVIIFSYGNNIPQCVHGKGATFSVPHDCKKVSSQTTLMTFYDVTGRCIRIVDQRPVYDRLWTYLGKVFTLRWKFKSLLVNTDGLNRLIVTFNNYSLSLRLCVCVCPRYYKTDVVPFIVFDCLVICRHSNTPLPDCHTLECRPLLRIRLRCVTRT